MIIKNKNNFNVVVSVCELGGFGDVVSSLSIMEYFTSVDLPYQVSFDCADSENKLRLLINDEKFKLLKHYKGSPNIITISPVRDRRTEEQIDKTYVDIQLSEYDHDKICWTDYSKNHITIKTGFSFDHDSFGPQAGIYTRKTLESILTKVDKSIGHKGSIEELRKKALTSMIRKYPKSRFIDYFCSHEIEKVVKGGWSLFYPSDMEAYHFLDIASFARENLDKPLYIFSIGNANKNLKYPCLKRNITYYNLTERERRLKDENISVIELGAIPDFDFMQLVALTDKLSLVTGDHSLSQMIQKSQSKLKVPFVYHYPIWKFNCFKAFSELIGKENHNSSEILSDYGKLFGRDSCINSNSLRSEIKKIKSNISKLFYDEKIINDYNKSISKTKENFINERKEKEIDKANILWSVNETLLFVVNRILDGRNCYDAVEPLLAKKEKPLAKQGRKTK
ncbi:hypothetical protein AUJ83_01280 [Candidatus Woesearchaeota archaeon CG1_02_33_12]|nr:MAG: hypothetical protein AUJ83_01280 [Candidatus Woesearchaeota archaeon CG1_02_33_12]PIN77499.1 MAG: hypothetical protein COV14_05875 [Candidatus Woesearchaeota archaeon CG10_big_fil_rev_8_21_14_0_10_33_12]PIU72037.1 MAG: hypothetical protein COS79_04930 [Candidatus Woesearchaeota archaeon CG06_land_8_20_14_3_00_33_13]